MSEVREEYTRETYPSFGKKYNGEKAIISLTSWKARINTVSKTLFSLLQQCPGFHIVLVLSEEEFPKMIDELPENLKLFVDNELVEVLWVYKNYKSFKKVLFTIDKYRDVPVISADDDCIYTCNYAQELYKKWEKNKSCIVSAMLDHSRDNKFIWSRGPATLFRPYCFLENGIKFLPNTKNCINDDAYIWSLAKNMNIKLLDARLGIENKILTFHTNIKALSKNFTYSFSDFISFDKYVRTKIYADKQ